MHFTKAHLAVLSLIIANTIWGAAPPIFKWSLFNIEPFTLAFLRFSLASFLIFPFALNSLKIKRKDMFLVMLIAFFGVTINILMFFFGLQYAPSINASVIGSAGPIFLIFFSILYLKEKPKRKLILGSVIGLIGVLIIIFKPLLHFDARSLSLLGNLLLVGAMLASIVQTVLSKKIMQRYSAAAMTFWSFFIGALTFFPFFLLEVENKGFLPNLNMQGVLGILFGAVLSSFVAYFLFFWALKYLSASETGVFLYIDPIITVLIAAPLLHEIPDMIFLLGALLVFGGILIAEGRLHYHPVQLLFSMKTVMMEII